MDLQDFIKELERLKDIAGWEMADKLTDYARERVYMALTEAIEQARENYEG